MTIRAYATMQVTSYRILLMIIMTVILALRMASQVWGLASRYCIRLECLRII